MSFLSHDRWRIRFLETEAGEVFALENLQFRLFAGADPILPCGTEEQCRASVESVITYDEQAEGTRAADLWLYGGGFGHWASDTDNEQSISRYYSTGRAVGYVALIATGSGSPPTRITRFAIDWSDDGGASWTEVREFTTNGTWGNGETRVFALPLADSLLPVFSFRPNWREPIPERLFFLTDVLQGAKGAEQRRSLRPTPRRTLEIDFLLTGAERTFWDLFMNRLGGGEVMVPLPWEVVSLPSTLTAGVTNRIAFSTGRREWAQSQGTLAMLIGPTALLYEVVHIVGVDANGIDLASPVIAPWPKGTKLVPLRRGIIEQMSDPSHKTAGVAVSSVQFRLTTQNPWTVPVDDSPVYEGLPVFLNEPNWVDDLTVQFSREIARIDTNLGLPFQVDSMGRAFLGQAHRWFLPGKENLAKFRDLIYRHRGRTGAFWLPTFKADFRLVSDIGSSDTEIEVENVGFFYTGGPSSGREHIAIKHGGGTILRKIVSVIPGSTSASEKLVLDSPTGLALSTGQVRRISFADVARFDVDEFEITHFGGIDAHHETASVFRTIRNTRTAPLPIHFPIPAASMNSNPCGAGGVPHKYWRLRLIAGNSDRYVLRNLDLRTSSAPSPITPCGTITECRDNLEPFITYDEQLAGTRAADLWMYGSAPGGTFSYWSSEFHDLLPVVRVTRNYPLGRDVQYVALTAATGGLTTISHFAIDWSDDGVNFFVAGEFTTNPEWANSEVRVFSLL